MSCFPVSVDILGSDKLANENVPAPAPTRSDDQILLITLEQSTAQNFFRAFNSFCLIYENWMKTDRVGYYSSEGQALAISRPRDPTHQFVITSSCEAIMDFVNEHETNVSTNRQTSWHRYPDLQINRCLMESYTSSNVDYAGLMWEEFVQAIPTFLTNKPNLGSPTKKGRKDKDYVIPYCWMATYYNAYLEMVAKHDRKVASKKEGKKKPASAKQPKPKLAIEKSSKPAPAPKPKAQGHAHVGGVAIQEPIAEAIRPLPVVEGKDASTTNPLLITTMDDTSSNIVRDSLSPAAETDGRSDKTSSGGDTEESLKFPADEHVILEDPLSSTGTLSSIMNLEDAYAIRDQFINDKPTDDEPGKLNVEAEVVSMVTVKALEAVLRNVHKDDFSIEKDKSRTRRHDDQDPPPSLSVHIGMNSLLKRTEDTDSAHLLKIKQRPEWLKPIPDDEKPATLKPAWRTLYLRAGDMRTFMNWYCQKVGKTELTQVDFEGQAYEVVKAFYPDVVHLQIDISRPLHLSGPPGHVTIQTQFFFNKDLNYLRYGSKGCGQALSISKMKAARYHDFRLELLVSKHMWIDDVCTYDISASYDISHWWFNHQKFYIDRHIVDSSCKAVRTHMRILSVVGIKAYSRYVYDYLKEITLCRDDYQEYTIAEKDFKNLYPSDFEDLNLLLLQGHLNHLFGSDKHMLSTAINLWTCNLLIRQRVEDLQLSIESYQKQLNHTKPGWDATGYEYKHDYTIIESPRAVVFPVSNNERKIMRFNKIYKFSDGTLTNILEALHYRVKEYKVNRFNPEGFSETWNALLVVVYDILTTDYFREPNEHIISAFSQNRRDLPRDNPLVSVEVLRYDIKRSKCENKGIVPTEMELELEQTQQGSSHEVSVQVKMEMEIPRSSRVYFITACSYSTDTSNDLMKA
ncbi:hypothetical protein Tco_0805353 [Tanacetum coccineum]